MNVAVSVAIVALGAAAAGGCAALAAHATVSPRLHRAWVRGRFAAATPTVDAADDERVDLADLLDAVSRSVRAGSSVPAALVAAASGASRLPAWLDDVVRRSRLGAAATVRPGTIAPRDREARTARRALVLAGSSRHGPLEHGASLIRLERALLSERLAAVAPVRASVRILTIAPVAILTWLLARSPDVRAALVGSPVGTGALATGIALNAAGRSWMGRIVSGAAR